MTHFISRNSNFKFKTILFKLDFIVDNNINNNNNNNVNYKVLSRPLAH